HWYCRRTARRQVQRAAGPGERECRGPGGGVFDRHGVVLRLLPRAQGLAARPHRGAATAVALCSGACLPEIDMRRSLLALALLSCAFATTVHAEETGKPKTALV